MRISKLKRINNRRHIKILSCATALFFCAHILGQKPQSQTAPSPASPQTVCAFIVTQMTTLLPQQPTLCSGKQEANPNYYSISIFSPKNVLEGDARRSWSSVLFQTLENLMANKSLNGVCSSAPLCFITISDGYTAQHNFRYKTVLSKDLMPVLQRASSPLAPAEFSEHWYIDWWRSFFILKESDSPGSKENATQLGERACENYIAALRKTPNAESARKQEDHLVGEGGTILGMVGRPNDIKLPSCSVMLATEKTVYIALDFPDWMNALYDNNYDELPAVFGKIFDTTGYDGQVLIRSPWSDSSSSAFRVYYIFPLRAIEFAYEEEESGLRNEFDAGELLRTEFEISGQMSQNAFESSVLADAAMLKYTPAPDDSMIVDMTDGAEWKISKESFDRCNLRLGDKIDVSTLLISGNTAKTNGPPTLSTQKDGAFCGLTASFAKGW